MHELELAEQRLSGTHETLCVCNNVVDDLLMWPKLIESEFLISKQA